MPRLVQVDEHKLEAYLDGVLAIFTHTDKPGIIGNVGTLFGKHGVNIAQMAVGRNTPGGQATGVLNLDNEPTDAALAELRKVDGITDAQVVKLPPAGQLPAWLQG
ncbi:MAG: ACT domain-containing protein [Pirellulales bacterium]